MKNSIGQILLYESLGLSHLLKANKPTEALGYLIKEGIKRDKRLQRGIEGLFSRTSYSKEEPAQEEGEAYNSKRIVNARDAGRKTMGRLAARAERRAERYVERIGDIQIGGKEGRKKATEIQTHNPGKPATRTLSDKAIEQRERAENIRKRFGV